MSGEQGIAVQLEQMTGEATQGAFEAFAAQVRVVPSVEQVRGQVAGTYLHLVTYMNRSTRGERVRVYEAQRTIHDRFPHLHFEFDVVDRQGQPMEPAPTRNHQLIERIRSVPDRLHVPPTPEVQ